MMVSLPVSTSILARQDKMDINKIIRRLYEEADILGSPRNKGILSIANDIEYDYSRTKTFVFPTNNDDVDFLILQTLDDESLQSACRSSKQLSNLCRNEDFWRVRFINRYGIDLDEYLDNDTYKAAYRRLFNKSYCQKIYIALEFGYYPLLESYKEMPGACDATEMLIRAIRSEKLLSLEFVINNSSKKLDSYNKELPQVIGKCKDCNIVVMSLDFIGRYALFIHQDIATNIATLSSNDTISCIINRITSHNAKMSRFIWEIISHLKIKDRGVDFLDEILSLFSREDIEEHMAYLRQLASVNRNNLDDLFSVYSNLGIFDRFLEFITSELGKYSKTIAKIIQYSNAHGIRMPYTNDFLLDVLQQRHDEERKALIDLIPPEYFAEAEILKFANLPSLKQIAKMAGVTVSGTKAQLISRILGKFKDE